MGVNVIISEGMGGGAIDIFNEKGIEVVIGASGAAKTAAEEYLQVNLKSRVSYAMNTCMKLTVKKRLPVTLIG